MFVPNVILYAWMCACALSLQVLCEVELKRMRLSQANADLAEAAEKLEALRKKLSVSSCRSLPGCCFPLLYFVSFFVVFSLSSYL